MKLLGITLVGAVLATGALAEPKETAIDVAPVWAGHPVGFSLLTHKQNQFVAFYDADRRLTVGSRKLAEASWHFVKLPESVGWDSHNSIKMAMDDDGCIHLCANMHAIPLIYFRTAKPLDINTFVRRRSMIGRDEKQCTYPIFFRGPKGEFLFTYRSGISGSGDLYYNIYDTKSKTWRRLMEEPLISGEGMRNAYPAPLLVGPDGYFHMAWIWRDDGRCETNHTICYARSKDLIHWQSAAGKPLTLPITFANSDVVDPVPAGAGAINGNVAMGFDSRKRVIITYQKNDDKGFTQAYNARLEQGRWKSYQISSWDYHWAFGGTGCIPFEILIGPVSVADGGRLAQGYTHVKAGSGKWIVDEATMALVEDVPLPATAAPPKIADATSDGLDQRTCADSGSSSETGVKYLLRWKTLGVNRDRKRDGDPPPPSMLQLVRIDP